MISDKYSKYRQGIYFVSPYTIVLYSGISFSDESDLSYRDACQNYPCWEHAVQSVFERNMFPCSYERMLACCTSSRDFPNSVSLNATNPLSSSRRVDRSRHAGLIARQLADGGESGRDVQALPIPHHQRARQLAASMSDPHSAD